MRLIFQMTLLMTTLLFNFAEAHIPNSKTITERLVKTHGKGAYLVEQDVKFRIGADGIVLRERWIVNGSDSMKLNVSSAPGTKLDDGIRFESLYQGNKRTLSDPAGGKVISAALSPEFIEPFFHSRSSKSFLNALVKAKIVPASFLNERARPSRLDQIHHTAEANVRLGRTSGAIAWVFGEPSLASGPLNPSIWIEQDAFVIRRLRFPSEAELFANKYSSYTRDLKFPRERTLNWQGHSVDIRLVTVRALTATEANKSLGSAATIKPGQLPDHAQIREFYTRFR